MKGQSMRKAQLSNSFRCIEVKAFQHVARTLQRGGDVQQIMRSPAWQSLAAKFARMRAKAESFEKAEVDPK